MFNLARTPIGGGNGGFTTGQDPRWKVFYAYPYSQDPGYREMLNGLEAEIPVRFIFPDQSPSAVHLLDRIRAQILDSRLAVFDITGWNPNVTLEFGIALGILDQHRRNLWIYLDAAVSPQGVPSDLAGLVQTRYRGFDDLRTRLHQHLSSRFDRPPEMQYGGYRSARASVGRPP